MAQTTSSVVFSESSKMFNIENIFVFLSEINRKIEDIIPRLTTIEERLNSFNDYKSDLIQLKSTTSEILLEIKHLPPKSFLGVAREVSDCSSSMTDQSDCLSVSQPEEVVNVECEKYGLVMSDSDQSELAASTGHKLGCKVAMYNYSGGQVEPAMFKENLEFVYIQDSGKLGNYKEMTNNTVTDMTAYMCMSWSSSPAIS